MNKVIIGSIIRNRAWILPEYLQALNNIDYPNKEYMFMENDSTDLTLSILRHTDMDAPKTVCSVHTESQHWQRGEYGMDGFINMAKLRNSFLKLFSRTGADYLFSVDSDVIVPSDILQVLLEIADQRTIVGADICNIAGGKLDGKTPGNFMVESGGAIIHPPAYPTSGTMDVDVTGAVYLIPMAAVKAGVQYGPHSQGEDIPFCQKAKELGFKIKVCFDAKCEHRMIGG